MNQRYIDYQQGLRGKRVTVIGMGVSNRPLIHMLSNAGAIVTACDKNTDIDRDKWTSMGVRLCLGEGYLDDIAGDVVFRTPGMRPDNPALLRAAAAGSRVTGEMADFFALCPCPIYGITGSDGKTTTTTLIAEMLREGGHVVHLGGNIGTPLLTRLGEMIADDICVVELSSFQLMDMTISPEVAVMTNLSPNHMDWHKSMEEYVAAKSVVLEYQKPGGIAVLNRDNPITAAMEGLFETRRFGGHMVRDGCIEGFLPLERIRLRGWHNAENVMAAVAAVRGAVSDEDIVTAAAAFTGVAHRDEFAACVDGVSYYNDSIGTSPTRTIATLLAHADKVHLIAGGMDKKIPFEPLGEVLADHVACLYLVGQAADAIERVARRYAKALPIVQCGTIPAALEESRKRTQPGDTVLLSPACSSFDQYKNFEERGHAFCRTVKEFACREENKVQ